MLNINVCCTWGVVSIALLAALIKLRKVINSCDSKNQFSVYILNFAFTLFTITLTHDASETASKTDAVLRRANDASYARGM